MDVRKFKRLPVVVDAMKWEGSPLGATVIIDWILLNGGTAEYYCELELWQCTEDDDLHTIRIETLEGPIFASRGDWVIQGIAGEFYPCKPDIFEKIYEEVFA